MSDALIVGLITAGVSLIGIFVSAKSTRDKITAEITLKMAVMDTKLQAMTAEVQKHNNFAIRMPVVEEQIKVINHRLEDLEKLERSKIS